MDTKFNICTVKEECSTESSYFCTCVDPVALICTECIGIHLSGCSVHTIISIHLARDTEPSEDKPKIFDDHNEAMIEIQTNLEKIKTFRKEIHAFKHQIITQIEQRSQFAIDYLDKIQKKAEAQLKSIKIRLKSTNVALQGPFNDQGMSSIICQYQDKLDTYKIEMSTVVSKMLSLSTAHIYSHIVSEENKADVSDILKQYIYIPSINTNKLIRYDSGSSITEEYELTPRPNKKFKFTSTSILPNGNVLIVGGYPTSDDTYLYNPQTGECCMLGKLNTGRYFIHLYCHENYAYALGGSNGSFLNTAERIELSSNQWENLPNMKQPRCLFGSYCDGSRLYLFGGGYESSIVEWFDFRELRFEYLNNLSVSSGACVVGAIDDRVYVLNKNLKVLNINLETIHEQNNVSETAFWSLSDIIIQGKTMLFYCRFNEEVYSFDTEYNIPHGCKQIK